MTESAGQTFACLLEETISFEDNRNRGIELSSEGTLLRADSDSRPPRRMIPRECHRAETRAGTSNDNASGKPCGWPRVESACDRYEDRARIPDPRRLAARSKGPWRTRVTWCYLPGDTKGLLTVRMRTVD